MKHYAIINNERDVDRVISVENGQIVGIQEFDQFLDSYTGYTTGETKTLGNYSVKEIFPAGEI